VVAVCGLVGIVAALFLAVLLARRVRNCAGIGPGGTVMRVAAGGAVTAAAVHACFEFALHTPLVALTLAALVGLADGETVAERPATGARCGGGPRLAAIMLLLAACGTFFWRPMGTLDSAGFYPRADVRELTRALRWAPTSWQAWYHLGRAACLQGTPDSLQFGQDCLEQAVVYDPRNYQLWLQLGRLQLRLGDYGAARESFARVKALRSWVQVPNVPEA